MVNHWIKKKRREEARLALQRWCNKTSYDKYGFYAYDTEIFFKEHPECAQFKSSFKVNWNTFSIDPTKPDATGIPEVTIKEDN